MNRKRNERLCEDWKKLTKDALGILTEILESSTGIDVREKVNVHFKDNGTGFTSRGEWIPAYGRFISRQRQKITELESFAQYKKSISEVQPEDTENGVIEYRSWLILQSFLHQYLERNDGNLEFCEELFDELYFDFEKALLSETVPYRVLVFLENLTSEMDEILLDTHCKLRRCKEKDIEKVIQPPFTSPPLGIGPNTFLIQLDYNLSPSRSCINTSPGREKAKRINEEIEQVLLTLRLLGKGRVMKRFKIQESLLPWSPMSTSFPFQTFPKSGDTLKISESEVKTVQELWKRVNSSFSRLDNRFQLAIKRFTSSYDKDSKEDKLLDLSLALEALYLTKEEDRIAQSERARRAAILLGSNQNEKEKIEKDMKEIFQTRSGAPNVAHAIGGKEVTEEKVETAQQLTRKSLRKFFFLEKEYGGRGNVLKALTTKMLDVDFP